MRFSGTPTCLLLGLLSASAWLPKAHGQCSDLALPGAWGDAGRTCSTYEDHGGTAYCAHADLAESCCFCGGGSGTGPPPPPTYAPPTNPPPTYSPPTSAPPPDNECSDLSLPGAWGDAGRTCSTYEDHGGTAYCAHADLAESCCFCGGGSGTGPPPPPTYAPPTNPPPTAGPPPAPTPSPPAPTPSPPTSGPPGDGEGDSRMIAYLGNWQACPTPDQYAEYTHIVIAFAVSYTWSPSKNNCDSQCNIGSPVPICNNQNRQDLVDLWRSQGKKVIVSFGGAGMGGSWAGDNNDCWEYCFGKEASVVSQLDAIVRAQNFDGVDIDYEYFYNDGDTFSLPGSTGAKARYFLDTVTRDLKATLPAGQNLITHAPMEPDSEKGTEYYDILKANAANLDFLMPQYYNGWTRPALDGLTGTGAGSKAALPHYNDLVYDMFGGDATKVVFGFCISDCSGTGTNANAVQASAVMTELGGYHSCNGGAFFWVVNHDYGGAWSGPVGDAAGVGGSNCDA